MPRKKYLIKCRLTHRKLLFFWISKDKTQTSRKAIVHTSKQFGISTGTHLPVKLGQIVQTLAINISNHFSDIRINSCPITDGQFHRTAEFINGRVGANKSNQANFLMRRYISVLHNFYDAKCRMLLPFLNQSEQQRFTRGKVPVKAAFCHSKRFSQRRNQHHVYA